MDEDLALDLKNLRQYIDIDDYEEEDDDDDDNDGDNFYIGMDEEENSPLEVLISERLEQPREEASTTFDDNSIEACLVTNQMYQETLNDIINQLEAAWMSNKEKQREIERQLIQNVKSLPGTVNSSQSNKKFTSVMKAPYFKDSSGFPCPLNEDAITKIKNKEFNSYNRKSTKWTKRDKITLLKAVKANTRKVLMEAVMIRKEVLCGKLETASETEAEEINKKLKLADMEIENIKNIEDNVLFSTLTRELDWQSISLNDMEDRHSSESCEAMWKNALHPSISKKQWTKKEENDLNIIAKKYNFRDWDKIAEELGTKRNAVQCLQRYQRHLRNDYQSGPFSQEEHEKLVRLTETERIGSKIDWPKVFDEFKDRNRRVVRQHYACTIQNRTKFGEFSIEEDLVLIIALRKFGRDFSKIAQHIPGRNGPQLSSRSRLFERRHVNDWSVEEDKLLVRLYKSHGAKWNEIKKQLKNNHSNNAVQARLFRIMKNVPRATENVDNPDFDWPILPLNTAKLTKLPKRYVHLAQFIDSRVKWLKKDAAEGVKSSSWKRITITPVKSNLKYSDIEFNLSALSDQQIEFLWEEAKNILANKKCQKEGEAAKSKSQISKFEEIVESNLDSVMVQYALTRNPPLFSAQSYSLKESIEYEVCRKAIFNALNIEHPENMSSNEHENSKSFSIDSSSADLAEKDSIEGQKKKRDEKTLLHANETLREDCLIYSDEMHPLSARAVFPPTRPTTMAFKLLVMDRNRLAESAQGVKDEDAILYITGQNQLPMKCMKCRENAKKRIYSYSNYRNNMLNNANRPVVQTAANVKIENQGNSVLLHNSAATSIAEGNVIAQRCPGCLSLEESRDRYKLLYSRFLSLFLWPGLLSATKPPDEDIQVYPVEKQKNSTKASRREKRLEKAIAKESIKLEVTNIAAPQDLPSTSSDKLVAEESNENPPPAKKKKLWRFCSRNEQGEALPTRKSSRSSKK